MTTGSRDWHPEDAAQQPGVEGAATDGPLTPPREWTSQPASTPHHPGSRGEQTPGIDGVTFDRATERNSRAVIGMVLSGLALVGGLAWFVGFATPVLLVVGLSIGGIVMGMRGRAAARNGLATNGGLGLAAALTGVVAILAIVAVYALLLYALSQWT